MVAPEARKVSLLGLWLLWGCWIAPTSLVQAELGPGDVVIIGLQSDSPDAFAWVPLVDLESGEALYFTDAGWLGGAFRGSDTVSDGGLLFTVPAGGLRAGAVQLVRLGEGVVPKGYAPIAGPLGPALLPGTFGDQMAVFAGSPSRPRFLFAVSTQSSQWALRPSPNSSVETEVYPGLSDGRTAVAVGRGPAAGDEFDNAYYVGPSEGSRDTILAAVAEAKNWVGGDEPIPDLTNGTLQDGFLIGGGTRFLRGNSNQDLARDLSDAIFVFEFLFLGGEEPRCLDAADVNDDGAVDLSDGISLLGFLFLGGAPPAPPSVECAGDPTADGIGCDTFDACP